VGVQANQDMAQECRSREFGGGIVDLDGTLVDTLGDFVAALGGMLADLGLAALTAEAVRSRVGKGSEHLVRAALALALRVDRPGASEAEVAAEVSRLYPQAIGRYQVHYQAVNGRFSSVYPGVVAGLQDLRARDWPLVCLTNKPLAFAQTLLAAKNLDMYFRHVFGGDSFAFKKPHPLPVQASCRALGLAPPQVLMIGDSSNDAQAARAAGCAVLLVSYGYNHGQAVTTDSADAVVDSLTPCAPWLQALSFG
jgi:phosphoglycolate phosphatase